MASHTITQMQAKLSDLGYLAAPGPDGTSNIDGRFGERTLDAYNHYRASIGKGPVVKAIETEVEADLWPEEQPPPPLPKPSIFDQIGTLVAILNLAEGKTMNITADQITGIVRLVLGIAAGYFAAKGIGSADLWTWITTGVLTAIPAVWTWISNRPKTIVPLASK